METYKFKAECKEDINELLDRFPNYFINDWRTIDVNRESVEASFETNLTIDEIRYCMTAIPNGELMYQTVAPIVEYSGARNIFL